ncbi:MAG: enoyl-CoA hydratase-related protein [Bacteroidota bacterium]|nr:enoyl-CoA hydratase-related protein [Bacteroidota bacterium]MDX5469857.1 enoyl-CoA hydratase-related protein [Bacteroidota bacterium]
MTYTNILTEIKGSNFWITINRADKLNALNRATLQEIKSAVGEANATAEVLCIFLTGAGEKAFAAGADISEFAEFSVEQGTQMAADGHGVMNALETSKKPVIALVNGFALGGGCELAMACHLRLASDNARFGQPEVNLGLIPGYAGTQRLCQLIGKGKALELLMTGDAIKAEQALSLGLVNAVYPLAELHAEAEKLAEKLATKSPLALARVIECVNAHYENGIDGFNYEINAFGASFSSEDFKEGTQAFLQKRKAEFSGR